MRIQRTPKTQQSHSNSMLVSYAASLFEAQVVGGHQVEAALIRSRRATGLNKGDVFPGK